jgi:hypothetical protein
MAGLPRQGNIGSSKGQIVFAREDEAHWETRIERYGRIDLVHIFFGQLDLKSLHVGFQVLDLPLPDYRENVRCLVEQICKGLRLSVLFRLGSRY